MTVVPPGPLRPRSARTVPAAIALMLAVATLLSAVDGRRLARRLAHAEDSLRALAAPPTT